MTDHNTIPADKVRELKTKYEYDTSGDPERLLDHLLHDLDDLLPAPPQPTTGLLGRWAKHPEHGDVMCIWGKPDSSGHISVHWAKKGGFNDVEGRLVLLSELTFPEQTTRPEDVPAGEAWLVRHVDGTEFNAVKTNDPFPWLFFNTELNEHDSHRNRNITLIAPLTPERPGEDDLLWKYASIQQDYAHLEEQYHDLGTEHEDLALELQKAQEKIKALEQPWPAWRIEHDHTNLRVGEYIIDQSGDDGTVTKKDEKRGWWLTDSMALGNKTEAPFIVFLSKEAATPEAIEEAKRARDKETGE